MGLLKWHDPETNQPIATFIEERQARIQEHDARIRERDARIQAQEAARQERDARIQAEARARELEALLENQGGPSS